jgi:exodeoxyribonuclease VII large subunit
MRKIGFAKVRNFAELFCIFVNMETNNPVGLLALQEQVKKRLEEAFFESVWLHAEISEIKQHPSGHCYLTLVEKDPRSNALLAKASAVVWASSWRMIKPFFEAQTGRSLDVGMSVSVRVQVNYSVLYGLSLVVYDIDPSFTVGELELARQRTIARLEAEGMFGMNAQLELPALPRRLAVITSETAAGWRDFQRQLSGNEYGFRFQLRLFPALMQGDTAPASIIAALDAVAAEEDAFDAVLILRGGGGAMDLVCFDDYELAVNVAQFPLPVLTAIGHDHDYHIIDRVAHTHLKTPTALADWLLDRFAAEAWQLDTLLQRLHLAVRTHAMAQTHVLDVLKQRIEHAVFDRHAEAQHRLDLLERRLDAVNPQRALERGFLIALKNGRRTASAAAFAPGDRLAVMFSDGIVDAEVKTVKKS